MFYQWPWTTVYCTPGDGCGECRNMQSDLAIKSRYWCCISLDLYIVLHETTNVKFHGLLKDLIERCQTVNSGAKISKTTTLREIIIQIIFIWTRGINWCKVHYTVVLRQTNYSTLHAICILNKLYKVNVFQISKSYLMQRNILNIYCMYTVFCGTG
jgi:hypothetical protein